ncbi:MAG TPA: glutamate--tRNA ligase [Candidatus Thermoplasmatota archaeon]|nr:glutamate--tRNA ligase [Candidatus Thermoplasmatota archaeon]
MSDFDASVRDLARKYALENAVRHGGKATPGAVVGKVMGASPEARQRAKDVPPLVAAVVEEVNAMAPDAQRAAFAEVEGTLVKREKKEDEGPLKPLRNAVKGKVVLRLAPNPSGPPHFGHGRGMVITSEYKRMYDGVFILRFDDTDTTVKPPWPPAYEMFQETVEWLTGARPDRVVYASDRLERYYEVAEEAFRRGGLYVCECVGDAFRAFKEKAEPCPHRGRSVEENLAQWRRMLEGGFRRGEVAVRVKTDMQHKDPALRDWVAFRLADEPHPRVGDKYRVWPLLDFQSAVDDHDEGVTHIIRGKDLRDSTAKQEFLYAHLGWTYPETTYWGRVSVHEFGKFSKSILNKAIEAGEYTGWDDPRLPTFPALRRRGITPEGIRNFWLSFGITEKDVAASIVTLEAENKKVLESRHTLHYWFVEDPVRIDIPPAFAGDFNDAIPAKAILIQRDAHAKGPTDGVVDSITPAKPWVYVARKDYEALKHKGFRLKSFLNIDAHGKVPEGRALDTLWARENNTAIIQWVGPNALPSKLVTAEKPPDEPVTGLVEEQIRREAVGNIVQLERVGFARVDQQNPNEVVLYFAHP